MNRYILITLLICTLNPIITYADHGSAVGAGLGAGLFGLGLGLAIGSAQSKDEVVYVKPVEIEEPEEDLQEEQAVQEQKPITEKVVYEQIQD